jgi:hypothetical protein
MGDGRLNKCIDCTKKDVVDRYKLLSEDIVFVEKERKRGRLKHHRLYKGRKKDSTAAVKNHFLKFPEQYAAKTKAQHLRRPYPEAHKHHWSYNDEHFTDVIWLIRKDHEKAHRFLVYDPYAKKFRRTDNGALLESKDQHEEWVNYCLANFDD